MYLSLLVATGLRLFLHARDAALDGLKVFQLQFVVDDFLVAHRVYRAIDMHHVRVIETTQHVDYGIGLTDVCQELVAETLAFRRAFNQSGNVDNLDRGGHDALRIDDSGKFVQAVVGHTDYADVWLDCTKGKFADCALAFDKQLKRVDLPTLGSPTIPHCKAIYYILFIFESFCKILQRYEKTAVYRIFLRGKRR